MRRPSPVISLWLLISLALVVFVGLSFMEDLHVGSYYPERASFKEQLLASENTDIPEIEIDTVLSVLPADTVIPPDTTIHKIFIFGDSMTHNLSRSIARYGTKNNYKVTAVTWESSSILGWAGGNRLSDYIAEIKPDFIIISLGSNEMELKHFDTRGKYVKKILEKIDTIPYIWVGPPLWKPDKGVYSMLEDNIGKERIFRIDSLDMERGPDHVHPTPKGADVWVDSLMRWQLKSLHPIPAEKPDSGTSVKKHRFIYLHTDD